MGYPPPAPVQWHKVLPREKSPSKSANYSALPTVADNLSREPGSPSSLKVVSTTMEISVESNREE